MNKNARIFNIGLYYRIKIIEKYGNIFLLAVKQRIYYMLDLFAKFNVVHISRSCHH